MNITLYSYSFPRFLIKAHRIEFYNQRIKPAWRVPNHYRRRLKLIIVNLGWKRSMLLYYISINLSLFYAVSKFIIILDKKTNKKLVLNNFENDLKTIFIFLQKEIGYWMSPKFFNERHITLLLISSDPIEAHRIVF